MKLWKFFACSCLFVIAIGIAGWLRVVESTVYATMESKIAAVAILVAVAIVLCFLMRRFFKPYKPRSEYEDGRAIGTSGLGRAIQAGLYQPRSVPMFINGGMGGNAHDRRKYYRRLHHKSKGDKP